MNLTRFLGNNEKRINQLQKEFKQKETEVLTSYHAFSKPLLLHPSTEDITYLINTRINIASKIYNNLIEYHRLIGEDDLPIEKRETPHYAAKFFQINESLINLLEEKLAKREYFQSNETSEDDLE